MTRALKVAPYIFVAIFYSVISFNLPLTGDDLTWKSDLGMDRLRDAFADYNGRYLSNVLELILVRHDPLRYLTLTAVSFMIVYLVNRITFRTPNAITFLATFIILMLLPTRIFAQTYGWTAGYVNYVLSILFILIYIYYEKFHKQDQSKHKLALIFILALSTQLLVEHVTLYAIFLGIAILIKDRVTSGRLSPSAITYLIGAIGGAAIMFTNGAYSRIVNKEDTYRAIGGKDSILVQMLRTFADQIQQFLFIQNYLFLFLFGLAVAAIVFRRGTRLSQASASFVLAYITFLILWHDQLAGQTLPKLAVAVTSVLSVLFALVVLANLAAAAKTKGNLDSYEILFYFISSIVLSLPFLILTPYGGRAAYATYVLLAMCLLKAVDTYSQLPEKPIVNTSIVVVSIVLALYYAIPIAQNGSVERQRISIIDNTDFSTTETLVLPGLPNKQFHQMPDPFDHVYQTKFYKIVHEIPQDIVIEIRND